MFSWCVEFGVFSPVTHEYCHEIMEWPPEMQEWITFEFEFEAYIRKTHRYLNPLKTYLNYLFQ